jgi:hypothetical protein
MEVREGDQKLGRAGEQAVEQAHHGGANGDGGSWLCCSGARGKEEGFYRSGGVPRQLLGSCVAYKS